MNNYGMYMHEVVVKSVAISAATRVVVVIESAHTQGSYIFCGQTRHIYIHTYIQTDRQTDRRTCVRETAAG